MNYDALLPICFETAFTNYVLSYQGVHYRILYFFSGKNVVVVSHGLTKEDEVPAVEIRRAIERKRKFEANPKAHTFKR
jgi:hypothetical protein